MKLVPALKLLKYKRTKIIATVGPACSDPDILAQMIRKGVNVFRLNMSHGEHAEHQKHYQLIREAAAATGEHIAILADLCGPKIRTGKFRDGSISLVKGEQVVITMRQEMGKPGLICSQYQNLAHDVASGQRIFLADGEMQLKVRAIDGSEVLCEVKHGGVLSDHQGINLPDASVSAPSMTDKDYRDAEFAIGLGVDFLALSFVRHEEDVLALRRWLAERKADTSVIAKIERPEALEEASAIIQASDAIMVARGDLGVELPPEQVPVAQHILIDEARRLNKPVIVATQILESMIEHSRPTRAEATDIFHSVSSSADAVMLSGETAVGSYALEAVEMMTRVIYNAEAYFWKSSAFAPAEAKVQGNRDILQFDNAVAKSTALLSRDLMVRGIVVLSRSGATSASVSAVRPAAPVLGVTAEPEICRRMSLLWGVIPVLVDEAQKVDDVALAKELVKTYKLAREGDSILLVQGFSDIEALNHPSITALKV